MIIVNTTALTDLNEFAQNLNEESAKLIKSIHIQGGSVYNSGLGKVEPDPSAVNIGFDLDSARAFYERSTDLELNLHVYTKFAAYASPLQASVLNEIKAVSVPASIYLSNVFSSQEVDFYTTSCNADPPLRYKPHMDQQWYLKSKSSWYDYHGRLPVSFEELQPYLKVILYDILPAIGSVQSELQFEDAPFESVLYGRNHTVIGTPQKSCVRVESVRVLMESLLTVHIDSDE